MNFARIVLSLNPEEKLFAAIRANNPDDSGKILQTAAKALNNGADIESSTGYRGRTPLLVAAQLGRLDMVTLLLDHGADITAVDENGENALMLTVQDLANMRENLSEIPEDMCFGDHPDQNPC